MRSTNPVLSRELLERWRGRRATVALTLYLVVLSVCLYGLYAIGRNVLRGSFGNGDLALAGPTLGRFLLEGLLFLTLILVLFVVPAYAAAQLAGERERRTLPLLQATLLRPWEIVAGKLAASTAWVALLVVCTAPLAAATLFLGGVTVLDVLAGVGSILVTMIGVGGLALGISSLARRTATAVVLTYAAVLLLVVGTAVAATASAIVTTTSDDGGGPLRRPPLALYGNPFYGLADAVNAVNPAVGIEVLPSPLSIIAAALPDSPVFQEDVNSGVGFDDGQPPQAGASSAPPTWLIVGGVYVVVGGVGFAVATRRLRDPSDVPSRRQRRRRRRAVEAGATP